MLDLREVGVGRAGDLAAEEGVEGLADEVAEGGEHGDATVGHLGLAETLDLGDGRVGGETEGIEVANGGEGAGEAKAEGLRVGGPAWGGVGGVGWCGVSFVVSREGKRRIRRVKEVPAAASSLGWGGGLCTKTRGLRRAAAAAAIAGATTIPNHTARQHCNNESGF